jgi:hypothetical protein
MNFLNFLKNFQVPPTITRIPSSDVIILNEGDSISVQCLTQGNPMPHLTWSKRGEKADHTKIDDAKSTLNLQNVDVTHSDSYSCTANNDIGFPVTSEFQILIRCKNLFFFQLNIDLKILNFFYIFNNILS